MHHHEVLSTIELAHYFNSAFTRLQVWKLLLVKMDFSFFNNLIDELLGNNRIIERKGHLYKMPIFENCENKKKYSRLIFNKNKFYIYLLTKVPFIKYIGLTGSNAFESCKENDDIDLFVVTGENRLWLSYLLIVIVSRLFNKREILCVNYLVDENNLAIKHQNYYTAVQLMHMIPLYDNVINSKLVEYNLWVKDYLPNADNILRVEPFYLLKVDSENGEVKYKYYVNGKNKKNKSILTLLNILVYKKYYKRLQKKYPKEFGKGIVLSDGIAKLNREDYQEIYNKIFYRMKDSVIQ